MRDVILAMCLMLGMVALAGGGIGACAGIAGSTSRARTARKLERLEANQRANLALIEKLAQTAKSGDETLEEVLLLHREECRTAHDR